MLFLNFEDAIAALEAELAELRHDGGGEDETRLQSRIDRQLESLYGRLAPWQTVQVARHPDRPGAREIIHAISRDFIELHGDRANGDDPRAVCGIARIKDHGVVLIGHDRTHPDDPPKTDGLCKTERLLRLADRFRLPVVIIAAAAADDGNIGLSLNRCLDAALDIRVPLLTVISGALAGPATALYVSADATMMLEHAVLSPLPPEAAVAALWPETTDPARALAAAAESLGLTAAALKAHGVIDAVIPEPPGGAHRHPRIAAREIGAALLARLETLRHVEGGWLRARRRERLAAFGRTTASNL